MPAFILDSCFGFIKLRTACLIIGYLSLIEEISFIIVDIVALCFWGAVSSKYNLPIEIQLAGDSVVAIIAILLLAKLVALAFTVVLLVGVYKNQREYLKTYLIASVIYLAVLLIMTLISFGVFFDVTMIIELCYYMWSIYFLMIIRSYYYKMDEQAPPVYNAA